jgi:hypothetical protein
MAREELHDVVDIDKIEPKSVRIVEKWDEPAGEPETDSPKKPGKKFGVTYTLPIAVSRTWQAMFQKPDPTRSGVVHQVEFSFSHDGKEVRATQRGEPSPELLLVLKSYAKRANDRWGPYKERRLNSRSEEEKILKALQEAH